MPLSEHEQRLLDEIEHALYAEDPKFASSVRGARARRRPHIRSTALLCVLGVLAGLGLVLVGLLATIIALSVVGFVVLVASSAYGVQAVRRRHHGGAVASPGDASAASRSDTFRARMEERMRRRFEDN